MTVPDPAKLYFQMVLSLLVVGVALYLLAAGSGTSQNWASGIIGSVLTFWFRSR